MAEPRMNDRVAIVTGGNAGIGEAAAHCFARRGAAVVIAARRQAEGERVAREIRANGGQACFVATDVSRARDVESLIEATVAEYGRLDYAFNNAGVVGPLGPLTECDEERWNATVDINLKGIWLCMKYEIPRMLQAGGGAIVNMSSVVGLSANALYGPAYVATKHGILGLTKLAAVQFATQNIRVNAVCPGTIRTPMVDPFLENFPGLGDELAAWHAMKRHGMPEEVGEAVVWLCSEGASFITGAALPIDGGALVKLGDPPASLGGA